MAATNETMKVIAEGIDQKKSPDIIMDGTSISFTTSNALFLFHAVRKKTGSMHALQ